MQIRGLTFTLSLLLLMACGGTKTPAPSATELFTLAQTSHSEARYADAVLQYSRYTTDFPDSTQAAKCQFMVAYLYANELDQIEQARAAYESFLENYPDSELRSSAEWELEHLGENLSDIEVIPSGD